jgi:NAD(P)-dependent dehydrogenase (short-subunit alcohol dehydrogenase family)
MALLDGRLASVAGAGRGIGRAHAIALARAGAAPDAHLTDRARSPAKSFAVQLRADSAAGRQPKEGAPTMLAIAKAGAPAPGAPDNCPVDPRVLFVLQADPTHCLSLPGWPSPPASVY